jgi:hypothetical protein
MQNYNEARKEEAMDQIKIGRFIAEERKCKSYSYV